MEAIAALAGPVSLGQEQMWWLQQLDPDSGAYNVVLAVEFADPVDRTALTETLRKLAARHRILRTRYLTTDSGTPAIDVLPDFAIPIDWHETAQTEDWQRIAAAALAAPFALDQAPPVRGVVVATAAGSQILVLVLHHIAADGWSLRILHHDLEFLYDAEVQGTPAQLPPPEAEYEDFAAEQRAMLDGPEMAQHLDFWRTELAGFQTLELPLDRLRPPVADFAAVKTAFALPADRTAALRRAAMRNRCTPSGFLAAAFELLLARYSGQTDITMGNVFAGRTRPRYRDLVGYFANPTVLRLDLAQAPTFDALLAQAGKKIDAGHRHQDLPFERLVAELRPQRTAGRNVMFDVLFTYHGDFINTVPDTRPSMSRVADWLEPVVRFDLELDASVVDGVLSVVVGGRSDLYDESTIIGMGRQFERILDQVISDPKLPLDAITLVDEQEADLVLRTWNRTQHETRPVTVADLLSERALQTPDARALVFNDQALTYRELDEQSNRLADLLRRDAGVGPETVVALALPRSADHVVAVFAVMKAGGAHVTLDVDQPATRLAQILADARPSVIVTTTAAAAVLPSADSVAVRLMLDDRATRDALAQASASPSWRTDVEPASAAYILYTSGSTGRPKGVVIEHRSLTNLALDHEADLFTPYARNRHREAPRYGLTASFSFDTWWEGPLALVAGWELHVLDDEVRRDPERLVEYVDGHRIDMLDVTPSYATQLLDAGLAADAAHPLLLMLGGEATGQALWDRLRPLSHVEAWNYYGPTECTVDATAARLADNAQPLIGRPLRNTHAYILDADLRPVPPGVRGELYLSGVQLARGYLNNAASTAASFIADPYGPAGSRMYRTGDIARWRPDGSIECFGRADDQIKIRGFRIEPREIEAILRQDADVADVVVVARADDPGTRGSLRTRCPARPRPSTSPVCGVSRRLICLRTWCPRPSSPWTGCPRRPLGRWTSGRCPRPCSTTPAARPAARDRPARTSCAGS